MMSLQAIQVLNRVTPLSSFSLAYRGLSTTSCLNKNVRSGVPRVTRFRTKTLTYEQANPPSVINVRKGWLSWNSGNLHGEKRKAETIFEDVIVRKFMEGTWHRALASEVIIKRRNNTIVLAFMVLREYILPRQIYFLKGYTEELLSNWLKCQVKCELQTVQSREDLVFKKI